MKLNGLKSLFIFLCVLLGVKTQAQVTLIDAKIEHADILIGEQTVVHLNITVDNGKFVYWPIPLDTLMRGVEVLAVFKPDTTLIDNNRLVIKQDVLITSFDEELYLLPPFRVIDEGDTIYSNQVALKVSTIPVNADAPEEFFDIKDVWKPPFVLADYYPIIFGVLLILFMICVIGYIVQRLRNRKVIVPEKKYEPKIPPHEIAIKELNDIKLQKLWQQGRNKEYYTLVTDTLRRYIFRRFGINAMEMTSYEILELVQQEYYDTRSVYDTLKQILQLADYVKFAKLHPLPDENNLSLANSFLFVNQTKFDELAKITENTDTEQQASETNESDLNKGIT
jgi:hypothetical protein